MRMKMKAIILHSVLTLVCFADIIQSSKKNTRRNYHDYFGKTL